MKNLMLIVFLSSILWSCSSNIEKAIKSSVITSKNILDQIENKKFSDTKGECAFGIFTNATRSELRKSLQVKNLLEVRDLTENLLYCVIDAGDSVFLKAYILFDKDVVKNVMLDFGWGDISGYKQLKSLEIMRNFKVASFEYNKYNFNDVMNNYTVSKEYKYKICDNNIVCRVKDLEVKREVIFWHTKDHIQPHYLYKDKLLLMASLESYQKELMEIDNYNNTGDWDLAYYSDDFGDRLRDAYIKSFSLGVLENNVGKQSSLTVRFLIDTTYFRVNLINGNKPKKDGETIYYKVKDCRGDIQEITMQNQLSGETFVARDDREKMMTILKKGGIVKFSGVSGRQDQITRYNFEVNADYFSNALHKLNSGFIE